MSIPMNQPQPDFAGLDRDTQAAICAVGRQLALRLDRLISALQPSVTRVAEPGVDLAFLLGLSLASYPLDHQEIAVSTAAQPLYNNTTGLPVPVMVTNNDNAQMLNYGCGSVGLTGPIIQPRQSLKINVPPGEQLYAVVAAGSVSVGLSLLHIPR